MEIKGVKSSSVDICPEAHSIEGGRGSLDWGRQNRDSAFHNSQSEQTWKLEGTNPLWLTSETGHSQQ